MFDKIHAARLTALADHMENEPLKLKSFSFSYILMEGRCGTVGCALGEASLLWPDFKIKPYSWSDTCKSAQEFFGMTEDEVNGLFSHGSACKVKKFGGVKLDEYASPSDVASNIRTFLEYKANEPDQEF